MGQHANEQQKHIPWRCKKYLFADHATPSSHPSSWAVVRPGTGVAREGLGATTIKFRNNVNWTGTLNFSLFSCSKNVQEDIPLSVGSWQSAKQSWPQPLSSPLQCLGPSLIVPDLSV